MEAAINATLDYLGEGHVFTALINTYTSVLGVWFWFFIILIFDLAIFLKSKNAFLTMIFNIFMIIILQPFLNSILDKTMLTISALVLASVFYLMFKR